ncbi:MAG: NUDIX domain-containing protein [Candidatus Aenigmarchaeota archaeon]|nr:NUDIX domain-containing protein [Candidatus Aenigmarchaeota archaeon]
MGKEHFKLVCAVYLILKRGGNYGLVSGHIDGEESVLAAIAREAKEEAGIGLEPRDLKVTNIMHRKFESPNYERFCVFLETSRYSGEIKNMEPGKCDDIRWFPINDLPPNTIDYVKWAIENSSNGIFFSEDGWG